MKKLAKKYQMFLKYIITAVISFLIDISFFALFNTYIRLDELPSTILARCISSPANFFLNKKKVFKSDEKTKIAIIKYFTLVIIQMFVSGILVEEICNFVSFNAIFIKMPVEIVLFICNFLIQKMLIFKK